MAPICGAIAQTADQDAFRKYIASPEHRQRINKAIASLPPEVFKRCPALVSLGSKVSVVKAVAMGADGAPKIGAWWQRFPVQGCGNDTVLNFYFAVGADGKIATTVALPGTTRADLTLQHDAIFYATLGPSMRADMRAKDCKNFIIKNTRFESFGRHDHPTQSAGDAKSPWWETWTVTGCGHNFSVPMDFTPDATGTQITQRPKDVTEF